MELAFLFFKNNPKFFTSPFKKLLNQVNTKPNSR